jgi:hypothetical protein
MSICACLDARWHAGDAEAVECCVFLICVRGSVVFASGSGGEGETKGATLVMTTARKGKRRKEAWACMTLTHAALIKLGPTHNAHHTGLQASARPRPGVEMAAVAVEEMYFMLMSEAHCGIG